MEEIKDDVVAGIPGAPPAPAPEVNCLGSATDQALAAGDAILYKTKGGWSEGRVETLNGDKVLIRTVNAKLLTRTRKNVKRN